MRNGTPYEGTCSKNERKMFGIQDLVNDYGLTGNEKIVFTYFGEWNFLVMIFDSTDVEAMLVAIDSETSGNISIIHNYLHII